MSKLFEMKATEFHRMMLSASVAMSKDKSLPALNAVRLDVSGQHIIAAATDRFRLAVAYAGDPTSSRYGITAWEDAELLIPSDTVTQLVKLSKTTRTNANWRMVVVSVEGSRVSFEFTTGESISAHQVDAEFPRYRQLIPTEMDNLGTHMVAVDMEYMGSFAKVPGSSTARWFLQSERKPAVVKIGDNFIGLIMPVGYPDETAYQRPSWLS